MLNLIGTLALGLTAAAWGHYLTKAIINFVRYRRARRREAHVIWRTEMRALLILATNHRRLKTGAVPCPTQPPRDERAARRN